MRLVTEPYREQAERWPRDGRHILAQYDEERVVVYQAYRPEVSMFTFICQGAVHNYLPPRAVVSRS